MSEEIKVNDKRLFTKDGRVNEAADETAAEQRENTSAERGPTAAELAGALPPPNFASLLVGLATSAFMHLGENPMAENEAGGRIDLPAAKQAIDILAMLQEKTKGNLDPEEDALLNTLLYDLRMKFVAASGGR